jgi:hypothetical protein
MPTISVYGEGAGLSVSSSGSYIGRVFPGQPLYVSSALPLLIEGSPTLAHTEIVAVSLDGVRIPLPWRISLIENVELGVEFRSIPSPLPTPPVFNPKPGQALPLPVGVNNLGAITEVCDIEGQGTNGNFFYRWRNRYTDQSGSWHRDMRTEMEIGQRSTECQGHAPPTAKDWQDGIQKQVTAGFDTLSKYVTDGLKSVTESWQNGILDLEGRLKAWVQGRITEALAPVTASIDAMKAWIVNGILEILLTKLMEGRKNDNSR